MKNLKEYNNYLSNSESKSALSERAKSAISKICEELLIKEAKEYHEDEHDEHTYEGYIGECKKYLNEIMGQSGYAPIIKPHAE